MDLIGLVAVIGAFGIGPAIVYLRGRHKLEERRLELEARTGGHPPGETRRLTEENKLLRERVENLESIVCSVDFELNQKLAKVIDEQRSLILPAGASAGALAAGNAATTVPGRAAGAGAGGGSPALERTAPAAAVRVATVPA